MFKTGRLLFPILFSMFFSCNNHQGNTYAIKDFRKPLRPYLIKIVSKGIVMYYDSALRNMATDKELVQLSQSEHPVLRASAFTEMLHRKSFNYSDFLLNHLDDTAIIASDKGEFGVWYRTVSDDILELARRENPEIKNKTIEQVLIEHNYLRSAYLFLFEIEPQEKYYSFIKDMATRPRRLSEEGYELGFDDIEYALYGLAKFKKEGDIKIIKEKLLDNVWKLSDISFRLMKEFPDTAYLDVFQSYHRRQFYNYYRNRCNGFNCDRADPKDFIQALAVQQTDGSARLLDTILNRLPLMTCLPDKENIENELVKQIWEHPNPSYIALRKKIKARAEKNDVSRIIIVPVN